MVFYEVSFHPCPLTIESLNKVASLTKTIPMFFIFLRLLWHESKNPNHSWRFSHKPHMSTFCLKCAFSIRAIEHFPYRSHTGCSSPADVSCLSFRTVPITFLKWYQENMQYQENECDLKAMERHAQDHIVLRQTAAARIKWVFGFISQLKRKC